ncbi:MAG: hypothetical protein RIS88_301 [Pseudomonadota bacterium]|jgi:tripartite-type tricarboxylate transporter receptor subunit TctC
MTSRLLASLALIMSFSAFGQAEYPTKPVRIVVPLAAGGITDIAARLMASKLSERTGQNFIVENRPGPGGIIGAEMVAKSTPDGYTLLMGTVSSNAISQSFYPNLGYNVMRDFTPLHLVTTQPLMLVVSPSVPANTLLEFVRLLKSDPTKYSLGNTGVGTSNHLATVLFGLQSDTKPLHVPYKGSGPLVVDLLAGTVAAAFDNLPTALAQVRTGKLKALAVTSGKRFPAVPDVPTVAETYPSFQVTSWQGMFAPSGTPEPVVRKLVTELQAILRSPDVTARISSMGAEAGTLSGPEFGAFVRDEITRWGAAVKASGAKPE